MTSRPFAWSSWIKRCVGVGLLLPSISGTFTFYQTLTHVPWTHPLPLAILGGAGIYFVMHLLLWKPIFMHVMGHELTHAFWALLWGGRIKSVQISSAGGQVTLSKTNFFIALAPYFFPFYTALLLPIYFIAAIPYKPWLALGIGFTLMFHLALTLYSLRDHQSDIRDVGWLFSLSFIYFMNLVMLVGVFWVVMPEYFSWPNWFWQTLVTLLQGLQIFQQQFIAGGFAHPRP
jgi:hypothetical protein